MDSKIHYYGWNYIRDYISVIAEKKNILIIDYVDHYFLEFENSITKDWYGIIHHTNSNFSSNNIINLFQNKYFLNSLEFCKGIITLSENNKNNILKELDNINLKLNLIVLKHPMPPTFNKIFDINRFENNMNIYNIGGWLRDPYSIYKLNIIYNNKPLNKIKLKGHMMEQYFPDDKIDFNDIMNNYGILSHNNNLDKSNFTKYSRIFMCRPIYNFSYYMRYLLYYIDKLFLNKNNKYFMKKNELVKHLEENHNSVQVIEYLNNEEYLDMLISNIVFCDYIDCSISNTIIECIATCTPIILNKHKSIIEYLGEEYPLYYERVYDKVNDVIILTTEHIINAHKYLLELNKEDMRLEIFLNKINEII